MKQKITLWKIILIIVLVIAAFVGYKIYKFNSLNSNVEVFSTSSNSKSKFIGVISNDYYKLEDDRLKGFKQDNNLLFDIEAKDIADIVYDKYIYIIKNDGSISSIDRHTGEEKRNTKLDSKPVKSQYIDKELIIYCEDSIIILSNKLSTLKEINGINNPISFSQSGKDYSLIELNQKDNNINSRFTISNGEENSFNLFSSDEVFLRTKIMGDNIILLSNRYLYLIEDNSILKKKFFVNITAVDINKDKIAIVNDKELIVFDKNLEEISRRDLGREIDKVKILNNSIFLLSKDKAIVYENENILEDGISEWLDWYTRDNEFYIIFENKIQRVNAY